MVIKMNPRTGQHMSELDEFDLELGACFDALQRKHTPHEETLIQQAFERLLDRAESHLAGWEP